MANVLADKGHNIYYLANGYLGQNILPGSTLEDGYKFNFNILGGGREAYFKDLLPIYMKTYKIDVLIILLDTFMLYPWLMQLDLSPAKTIFYYPSDGGGHLPLGCEQILKFINKPIAMAKFGQGQVKKVHGIETGHIPHAIDEEQFKPLSKEEKLQIRARYGIAPEKFVVGTVARNQGRKMLDRTIKAFSLYAKENPNAILFLHTDPEDAAQVFHLPTLIQRYSLENRVRFSGMRYYKGFDYKIMNEVYNVMDVFLLTTSGEGFGIPIIEAMSAGIPVLATDYTTTRELVIDNKAGLGIPLVGTTDDENELYHGTEIIDGTITGSWNVERGICSIKKCAEALKMFSDNPSMGEAMGKNGREAILKEYTWKINGERWIKAVEEIGGEY